jgi:hypothetical protein
MEAREAILGPFQLAAMETINKIVNLPEVLDSLPPLNAQDLFYSVMFQSGVEGLELIGGSEKDKPTLEILAKRVTCHLGPEWAEVFMVLHETFYRHLGEDFLDTRRDARLGKLFRFLVDLLYALRRGKNLISIFDVPKIEATQELLPAELLLPIKSLMANFHHLTANLPSPRITVGSENVALFEEIILSVLFKSYEKAHQALDDVRRTNELAIDLVRNAARRLCESNSSLLRPKGTVVSLLPLTSKLIDQVFGKLPGALAEFSVEMVERWIHLDRRLVIYEFDEATCELVRRRWAGYSRRRAGESQ